MTNQENQLSTSAAETDAGPDDISIFSFGSLGGDVSSAEDFDLRVAVEKEGRLDQLVERLGDRCSSIMVKETRQATKSRHFVWTFFATIIITLIVTFVIMSSQTSPGQLGKTLLMSYLIILGLPLMIIVPISTFQSLSAEHGDGTLQLISITTMKPSEIIVGKLCSAVLQILIYMSVLAPCITFTFLLRGVDVYQIIASLLCAFGFSVSLCCLGLAMGSISTTRMVSAAMQLVFACILLFSAWMWGFTAYGLSEEFANIHPQESFAIAGCVCAVLSTAGLLLVAATAQITFASDNRSTYLRLAMLVQQTLFIAFVIGIVDLVLSRETFIVLTMIALHYWLLMGSLMSISSHQLSKRVRRTMPQTIVGRLLGGLLMPGPGRAFLFAWTNGMFCCLVTLILFQIRGTGQLFGELALIQMAYFSLFLSGSYIFNRLVKRYSQHTPIWTGVLGLGIVMFMPSVFVAILDAFDQRNELFSRSFLAYANWYAAIEQVQYGNTRSFGRGSVFGAVAGFSGVFIIAFFTMIYAMLSACREFSVTAMATPTHVLEEDRDHALRNPLGQKGESIDDLFD